MDIEMITIDGEIGCGEPIRVMTGAKMVSHMLSCQLTLPRHFYETHRDTIEIACDICDRIHELPPLTLIGVRVLSDEEYAAMEPQSHRDMLARVMPGRAA